jgi:pectin methylesterase-like acyl-CoA thioesterase
MNKNTFLLIFAFWTLAFGDGMAQKWNYDFIVPDDGNFMSAIHAANDRFDKEARFRIFIRSGRHISEGEGNTISTKENDAEVRFPNPIATLTASNTSIVGEDQMSSVVENRPTHEGISITSTLFLKGTDNTYLQDIQLYCNLQNNTNPKAGRAVALNERNCGRNVFRNVFLNSTQDTYWTNDGGTTYLDSCMIAGTVDFICGGGTIFFDKCNIMLVERENWEKKDIITAPATADTLQYGYVFNECEVGSTNNQHIKFCLGRPWKFEPRCVWLNCLFNAMPVEQGWDNMHGMLPKLFAEYNSRYVNADGSKTPIDLSKRKTVFQSQEKEDMKVEYNPELTAAEAADYTLDKVFPNWNPRMVCKQVNPPAIRMKGKKIVWKDVAEAGCYAVFMDDKLTEFTTHPFYKIPSDAPSGTKFHIRCANQMGGLGYKSNQVIKK